MLSEYSQEERELLVLAENSVLEQLEVHHFSRFDLRDYEDDENRSEDINPSWSVGAKEDQTFEFKEEGIRFRVTPEFQLFTEDYEGDWSEHQTHFGFFLSKQAFDSIQARPRYESKFPKFANIYKLLAYCWTYTDNLCITLDGVEPASDSLVLFAGQCYFQFLKILAHDTARYNRVTGEHYPESILPYGLTLEQT